MSYRKKDFYRENDIAVNDFRKSMGLKPVVFKERKCLVCEQAFDSECMSNRICYPCKRYKQHISYE